jgi:undecaprenyl-diphosphatase
MARKTPRQHISPLITPFSTVVFYTKSLIIECGGRKMTWWQALVLGVVQGLGEFLPISSSGHLVFFQNLFGITEAPLLLDTLLHAGTLVSVFILLWREFLFLFRKPFRVMLYLILATLPAVAAQLLFGDFLESAFDGSLLGWSFLATSLLLLVAWLLTEKKTAADKHACPDKSKSDGLNRIKWYQALAMGTAQAVAILPGVSRSGSTLCTGLLTGVGRETAVRFSFLMSIPVIGGSILLQAKEVVTLGSAALGGLSPIFLALGVVAAAVTGLLSMSLMFRLVRKGKLWIFALYTGVLGIFVILDQTILHWVF